MPHSLATTNAATLSNLNSRVFLRDAYSKFTFAELNRLASRLSSQLLGQIDAKDLGGEKVPQLVHKNDQAEDE